MHLYNLLLQNSSDDLYIWLLHGFDPASFTICIVDVCHLSCYSLGLQLVLNTHLTEDHQHDVK